MALSSSGQDGALSRLKLGFESRQGHAFLPNEKTPPGPPRAMPFFLPTHPPSSDKSPTHPLSSDKSHVSTPYNNNLPRWRNASIVSRKGLASLSMSLLVARQYRLCAERWPKSRRLGSSFLTVRGRFHELSASANRISSVS